MSFQFDERPGSGRITSNPPTKTLEYVSEGLTSEDDVHSYALAFTPAMVSTAMGILYRQDVQLEPQGHDIYYVTVPYAQRKRVVGSYRFSFSTLGGTTHIENSGPFGGTIDFFKADPADADPDFQNVIGFVQDDRVDGVDKVTPVFRFTIHFRHPMGIITLAQMKRIAQITGTVNDRTFLGFAAGEILFLGADGEEGTDTETEIAYHFEASQNANNIDIGNITVEAKEGHDYAWIKYEDEADAGVGVRTPRYVILERIYTRANLAAVLGFGG